MIETENILSPGGQVRREQILKLAVRHASDRRYGKIERRVGALVLIAACGLGAFIVRHSVTLGDVQHSTIADNSAKPAAGVGGSMIQAVQTDPKILQRLAVYPTNRVQDVNDDQLLASLAAAGRPAGLIEVKGQTWLVLR